MSGCCATVADSDLRGGDWRLCDCTGWPDNASFQQLVSWCWRSRRCAPPRRRQFVFGGRLRRASSSRGTTFAAARWELTDRLSGQSFERDGDELSGRRAVRRPRSVGVTLPRVQVMASDEQSYSIPRIPASAGALIVDRGRPAADPQADLQEGVDDPRRADRGGRRVAVGGVQARDARGVRDRGRARAAGVRRLPASEARRARGRPVPVRLRHRRRCDDRVDHACRWRRSPSTASSSAARRSSC